jgi:hypothetical protein
MTLMESLSNTDYIIRWINEIGLYLQHSKKSNIVDEILHEKLKLYGN